METKQTHWRLVINPDYIGAYMMKQGEEMNITIDRVSKALVAGETGKKECKVAYLRGQKPFILNNTNSKMIAKLLGSPYVEDWVGKTITVFATTTKVGGESVECLRVKPVLPVTKTQQPPQAKNLDAQRADMNACKTIAELVEVWKRVGCPELEPLKNKLKDELQK